MTRRRTQINGKRGSPESAGKSALKTPAAPIKPQPPATRLVPEGRPPRHGVTEIAGSASRLTERALFERILRSRTGDSPCRRGEPKSHILRRGIMLLQAEANMPDLRILQQSEALQGSLHEARWWEPEPGGKVHCYLCPRHCHIGEGQAGFCFIRANEGGKLYSLGYAHPAALQIDPIEKKPLNHFLPGTKVFSMGTAGCNMGCFFCQNWDISKSRSDQVNSRYVPPEDVAILALRNGCPSIAFTYNEPTIWGEYVIDICAAAKDFGLNTVMVSNGYITYEAFHDIYDHVDAANIDLKAFTENFYGKITLTHLQPVLDTLKWLKNETNVWFEITNLVIPTLNDASGEFRELAGWILENLGPDVPLHFTAFHPDFKLQDKPPTPPETLHAARQIALDAGLHYVYEGNIYSDGAHTSCPSCGTLLIERSWHNVKKNRLNDGHCPKCALAIPGRWLNPQGKTPPKISGRQRNLTDEKYSDLNL